MHVQHITVYKTKITIMKKVVTNIFPSRCTILLLALFLTVLCIGYIVLINDRINNEIYIELHARVVMVVTLRYYNSILVYWNYATINQ